MKRIYLSLSNQSMNTFTLIGYNENCYDVQLCRDIQKRLTQLGYLSCIIAEADYDPNNRPVAAKHAGCTLYISVHSAFSFDHKTTGTICYYHPEDKKSRHMANELANSLTVICTVVPNDDEAVQSGMRVYGVFRLIEIQKPHKLGMTAVQVEVNAHDNPDICLWLISSFDKIAGTISRAI